MGWMKGIQRLPEASGTQVKTHFAERHFLPRRITIEEAERLKNRKQAFNFLISPRNFVPVLRVAPSFGIMRLSMRNVVAENKQKGKIDMSIFGRKSQRRGDLPGCALAVFALLAGTAAALPTAVESKEAQSPIAERRIAATDSARYLVVILSAGAKKYPVSYLNDVPRGGWTGEYKTTKLVLRRIEAGSFIMGENQMNELHRVTLTKPFYCGVFEVTQKQYELVTGSNPSKFNGDARPVESVSYDMIRGKGEGAKWPASSAVDPDSFMGKLRARTGIDGFDLPTEAQWEYACRAGTTSAYNNGGDKEEDLLKLGRFTLNQEVRGWKEDDATFARHMPDGRGGQLSHHTAVGAYEPNAWGLYDMHGNVWEWCLDWNSELAYGKDPVGSSSYNGRVLRGGNWYLDARCCRSAHRGWDYPGHRLSNNGFRLCCSAGPRE